MTLRLNRVSGPVRDAIVEISAKPLTIGRSKECDVAIADKTLSRAHCVLQLRGDVLWIADTGGRNGTHVNGDRVSERQLCAGDRVQIGASVFVVEEKESTVDLDPGVARYLADADTQPIEAGTVAAAGSPRAARDLRALLAFNHTLHPVRERAVVHQVIVDTLMALFRADLVALALFSPGAAGAALIPFRASDGPPLHVSRTLLARVRTTHRAVLSNDVAADEDLPDTPSIVNTSSQSILCAPLLVGGEVHGALYVTSVRREFFFAKDDLELITALANVASLALENIGHLEWLSGEASRTTRERPALVSGLIGESAAIASVARFIRKASRVDTTVLVLGESGTGKELVARAIHSGSPRASHPFVSVNCAALPEHLVESELFGFESGAFSDARRSKPGRLELANRGTLFLDEVGELSLAAQAKLLRAIQEREVDRLGGTRPIRVDIRLIAATNRDLAESTRAGVFRADLYHRLNVLSVTVPPLRDRRSDIPLLAAHFLEQFKGSADRRIEGFSNEARASLVRYPWPGNVRELQNTIERAVVLGCADRIVAEDLPEVLLEHGRTAGSADEARLHAALNETKRRLVLEAFDGGRQNFIEAARYLGVHPNHLHRLVRNLDLRQELESARGRALT